jgi:hypothetical protein
VTFLLSPIGGALFISSPLEIDASFFERATLAGPWIVMNNKKIPNTPVRKKFCLNIVFILGKTMPTLIVWIYWFNFGIGDS